MVALIRESRPNPEKRISAHDTTMTTKGQEIGLANCIEMKRSYGSAEMVGWLVDERGIEPHVNLVDKTERTDGTFSRSDFAFDPESNLYVCPGGKELKKYPSHATG